MYVLQGIKAVLAESYERIHRSNLVGMGIIPLQYLPGENAEALGLTGKERYTILIPEDKDLRPGINVEIKVCSFDDLHISVGSSHCRYVFFVNGQVPPMCANKPSPLHV